MQVEYEVESFSASGVAGDTCIDIKRTSLTMPIGAYVIYGVAHQHAGGVGSTLFGQVISTLNFQLLITCLFLWHLCYYLSYLLGQ